jgi:sugar lactone lactonase YvrE
MVPCFLQAERASPPSTSAELDRSPFGCMLGGKDGQTLFILAAEWRGLEKVDEALAARTGQVLTVRAPAPWAGWP